MSSRYKLLLFILFITSRTVFSQTVLPIPKNIQNAYTRGTRDKSGAPGKSYWQNSADYKIKVSFNPLTRQLTGTVEIDYTNNSPDTLKKIQFKLYPNLFQKQAMRNSFVSPKDLTNGVHIESVHFNDQLQDSTKRTVAGTNMVLRGNKILPHQQVHLDINYAYTLNETSFIRTGQIDTGAFFIAYFFPRIAVYDDIDRWNEYPYLGREEFYNDYCHFRAEITVPGNYQVWATGDLKNADEVYNPKFANLISKASQDNGVIDIITEADLKAGDITKKNKTNTWIFEADNVVDLAFATSNHYVWKASSLVVDPVTKRRTRADAVFNPEHTTYLPVINYARSTVETISYQFPRVPFPYSHITIFDGLDAMEYPMMVNNLPFKAGDETVEFTTHEVFHTIFPFYVGTNETKYSFMDEGWATLTEFMLHSAVTTDPAPFQYDISDLNNNSGSEQDVPVMTLTPQLLGAARYTDKDLKPAIAYYYLREMLDNELYLKALNYYISQWHGKHPTPYDFFNCMNTGSGMNLNWFWKNWFFEKGVPDLAITKVTHKGLKYTVEITNEGTEAVPVHLTVSYKDGSTQSPGSSIACWQKGSKTTLISFIAKGKLQKIVLGGPYDADVNVQNNSWVTN